MSQTNAAEKLIHKTMSLQKETLWSRLIEIFIAVQTCLISTIFMFAAILRCGVNGHMARHCTNAWGTNPPPPHASSGTGAAHGESADANPSPAHAEEGNPPPAAAGSAEGDSPMQAAASDTSADGPVLQDVPGARFYCPPYST